METRQSVQIIGSKNFKGNLRRQEEEKVLKWLKPSPCGNGLVTPSTLGR
jgi:hypothetical protein